MYGWLAKYRKGGWDALSAKKRGGRPARLSGKAMEWIWKTVTMRNPAQMKFPFALWTCEMVGELIRKRFGVKLSRTSVGRLLARLGLSAQRPLWKAYQQNPERVREWLDKEYPAIREQARQCGADLYFCDEAGVRSDYHAGTTWGKRGKTPVVCGTGARFGFNIISAISPRGMLRFMGVEGSVGAATFIGFLQRLLHGATQPVYLIVDGHPSHKARLVSRFVEATAGKLKLCFLPGYSPELNPDELVWKNLKADGIGRRIHTTKAQMKCIAISHLRRLQRLPRLIRSFFQKPSTIYAACP
jgi:transposase